MNTIKKFYQQIRNTHHIKYTCLCIFIITLFLTSCGAITSTLDSPQTNEPETVTTESNNITPKVLNTVTPEVDVSIDNESENNDITEEVSITPEPSENTPKEFTELQIHYIDVGQGDCTLIICDSEAMLIDAGDNNQGTKVQNYLQKQGIKSLKYVICTHPDSDHIGGMDVILYKFDCETIFMTDEEKDSNTYRDVIDTMKNKGYKKTFPVVGECYSLGDAEFTILAPSQLSNDSNNNSIAIILTHGNNKFLFTGDAESEEEGDILKSGISIDADVYKVGHHGSSSSSSIDLLEAASPTYAVISCAEENSYGHPHAGILNNLRSMGVQVFRTDEQGSIIATSNGLKITWNCSPSDTWQAGEGTLSYKDVDNEEVQSTEEPTITIEPTKAPKSVTYICNTNTKKFHYPSCSSVKQMSEKNKKAVTTTREELIKKGYDPCKRCNP